VHRQYGFLLRVAEKIAHYIFTTSNEGFQIKSQKVIMTGHGIPVDMFARAIHTLNSFSNLDTLKLAMVGRITPIKDVMTFLKALVILKQVDVPVKVEIIGSPVLASDFVYFEELKKYISRNNLRDCIEWRNGFTYDQIPFQLVQCHIVVNLSPTGGVDKVVLESMAAGRVVVVLNKAFENYFGSLKEKFLLINGSAEEVAKKINSLWIDKALLAEYGKYLQGKVRETSDLCVLVTKICSYLT
jgi:glycosyltransferase involved in cell wall biosynthesis